MKCICIDTVTVCLCNENSWGSVVRALATQAGRLQFRSLYPYKKLGVAMCAHNSSAEELGETGGSPSLMAAGADQKCRTPGSVRDPFPRE